VIKVFVAGATGALGRHLVPRLIGQGFEVLCLARRPKNERAITSLGGKPRSGDLFDVDSLVRAAEGADVVVRTATAIPPGTRFRTKDWAMKLRVRRDGTRALTACAARIHAKLYVQEYIVWVAQPADGSAFDETPPVSPRLWYGSAIDAESIAREAGAHGGFEVATLRFGAFYAADSSQTRWMGQALVRRRLPVVGRGDAAWSNIHVDDAAAAIVASTKAMQGGLWHAVDDRPVSTAEFFGTFARLLDAPEPRRVPAWLAKLLAGPSTVAFLTAATRTTNARIRKDLGWSPRYLTHEDGLRQAVKAWRAEGFPAR